MPSFSTARAARFAMPPPSTRTSGSSCVWPAAARAPGSRRWIPMASEPTFEQARDELEQVVRRLEDGGTTLEEALTLWERGEELYRLCRARLDAAEERIA